MHANWWIKNGSTEVAQSKNSVDRPQVWGREGRREGGRERKVETGSPPDASCQTARMTMKQQAKILNIESTAIIRDDHFILKQFNRPRETTQ